MLPFQDHVLGGFIQNVRDLSGLTYFRLPRVEVRLPLSPLGDLFLLARFSGFKPAGISSRLPPCCSSSRLTRLSFSLLWFRLHTMTLVRNQQRLTLLEHKCSYLSQHVALTVRSAELWGHLNLKVRHLMRRLLSFLLVTWFGLAQMACLFGLILSDQS